MYRLHTIRILFEIRKEKRVMMTQLLSMNRHDSYQEEAIARTSVAPIPSQKADGIQNSV
jgi:hypothetical protein